MSGTGIEHMVGVRAESCKHSFEERNRVQINSSAAASASTRSCCEYEQTCEVVAGLSSHAWWLCLLFCHPTLLFVFFEEGGWSFFVIGLPEFGRRSRTARYLSEA